MKSTMIAAALLLALASVLPAQQPSALPANKMQDLAGLVGKWTGTGWVQYEGAERTTFDASESVEGRLDGLVLILEGKGVMKAADGSETVVHHGLSILTYEPLSRRYIMISIRQDGSHAVAQVHEDTGFLEWSYQDPDLGMIKRTVRLTESGQLFAVSDHSTDSGATWHRIFEMELARQK